MQDEKLDWARERSAYLKALDEATRTVSVLETLARDAATRSERMGQSLELGRDGELDLVAALASARKETRELQDALQAARLEVQKAEARRSKEGKERDLAVRTLEDR